MVGHKMNFGQTSLVENNDGGSLNANRTAIGYRGKFKVILNN
jgi:hypothetical protein